MFNVEHGACSLISTDHGKYIMIDCGHNATTGWYPGDALVARGIREIEALVITNYDEDHVSGLPNLKDQVRARWLYRNKLVSALAIRSLKSDVEMGPGIERLVYEIENVYTGGSGGDADLGSIELATYKHRYPDDFDDENNLSLVTFVKYGELSILFSGDMQQEGWLRAQDLNLRRAEGEAHRIRITCNTPIPIMVARRKF